MARRSARIASSQSQPDSSPSNSQSSPAATGTKRKAAPGSSPTAKRGKKDEKEQKTIEESMDLDVDEDEAEQPEAEQPKVEKAQPEEQAEPSATNSTEQTEDKPDTSAEKEDQSAKEYQANGHEQEQHVEEPEEESKPEAKEETEQPKEAQNAQSEAKEEPKAQDDQHHNVAANGENAVEANGRDAEVPSSILEKGIMYFFYRGRVNVDDPKSVDDIQRSFLVLRPLPHGAKLSDGPIGDDKNCRLIAIPKKMLPLSGNDRWIAFTESVNTSFSELRESFLKSDDYTTQTGPRHTPAATPAAEGVYAITSTGRESHLAYIITLPEELGSVQNDLGLRPKGSFVVSVKNPKAGGPANTNIGKDPGYSPELMNEFRGLRWMSLKPDHLNYEGCQFLMIGEGEQGLDKATEPQDGDEKKDETAKEEMEKLEGEDEIRVEHLNDEDAVFADLGTDAKDYPKLQKAW